MNNARLIAVGVASLYVNGAKYPVGVVPVDESSGPVVDRFAAQEHVVGI